MFTRCNHTPFWLFLQLAKPRPISGPLCLLFLPPRALQHWLLLSHAAQRHPLPSLERCPRPPLDALITLNSLNGICLALYCLLPSPWMSAPREQGPFLLGLWFSFTCGTWLGKQLVVRNEPVPGWTLRALIYGGFDHPKRENILSLPWRIWAEMFAKKHDEAKMENSLYFKSCQVHQ